jgi:hypothetical protein
MAMFVMTRWYLSWSHYRTGTQPAGIPVDFSIETTRIATLRLILVFESFGHPLRLEFGRCLDYAWTKNPHVFKECRVPCTSALAQLLECMDYECKLLIIIADHTHGSEPALCAH